MRDSLFLTIFRLLVWTILWFPPISVLLLPLLLCPRHNWPGKQPNYYSLKSMIAQICPTLARSNLISWYVNQPVFLISRYSNCIPGDPVRCPLWSALFSSRRSKEKTACAENVHNLIITTGRPCFANTGRIVTHLST